MEMNNLFNNDMYKFLKIYTYIKNNDVLRCLSENVEKFELTTNDEGKLNAFKKINSVIQSEANDILGAYNIRNAIKNEIILNSENRKPVRIYMDGVFDIIHSGHFNAIRQSKKLGDILVVGVNADDEVIKVKGPLIMDQKERVALIQACKWVDEVIESTPYSPTVEFLDKHNIDFCAHGDDMPLGVDGESCYGKIDKAGRLKVFKRTEGISTTEIIGRLLMVSKEYYLKESIFKDSDKNSEEIISVNSIGKQLTMDNLELGPVVSKFLTTSWRLAEFTNHKYPKSTDKVVFIDGAFDILHIGHMETLKAAKEMGDFLYVGLHDDKTINTHRGKNFPILSLQERIFNLLSIKYVDDVIIGSPWTINRDMINNLKIDIVVEGSNSKRDLDDKSKIDPYEIPKQLGIYKQIKSKHNLETDDFAQRILERRQQFIYKYSNKKKKEDEYYETKKFIEEL